MSVRLSSLIPDARSILFNWHRCPVVHARPRKEATTRAERAQRTRQAIVARRAEAVSQRGYGATSLQDIADELGLTKAAVYYHYNTKAELLHAVCAPREKTMTGVIDSAAHFRTRREKINALANGLADAMISKRQVMRVVNDPVMNEQMKIPRLDELFETRGTSPLRQKPDTRPGAGCACRRRTRRRDRRTALAFRR